MGRFLTTFVVWMFLASPLLYGSQLGGTKYYIFLYDAGSLHWCHSVEIHGAYQILTHFDHFNALLPIVKIAHLQRRIQQRHESLDHEPWILEMKLESQQHANKLAPLSFYYIVFTMLSLEKELKMQLYLTLLIIITAT